MPDELTGQSKLFDALTTKGTAFTHDERLEYGLLGLLPTAEKTLAQQVEHSWHEFSTRRDDLDKHIYLRALQDRNETLFYRLLRENITETMPIVYTPTVGVACQRFSEIYRRPRGLFVSYPDRDRLAEVINNRPHRNPDVIVVTDGQRILGLGDRLGRLLSPAGRAPAEADVDALDLGPHRLHDELRDALPRVDREDVHVPSKLRRDGEPECHGPGLLRLRSPRLPGLLVAGLPRFSRPLCHR